MRRISDQCNIGVTTDIPLAELWTEVAQVVVEEQIFVITAFTLNEALRRNDFTKVATKLKRMVTANPRHIVDHLVVVLNSGLRRVPARSETDAEVIEFEIRKGVETREMEIGHGEAL